MAKVVSQETYDSVVLENCVDFELSCEEAHIEAHKEFDAQVRMSTELQVLSCTTYILSKCVCLCACVCVCVCVCVCNLLWSPAGHSANLSCMERAYSPY